MTAGSPAGCTESDAIQMQTAAVSDGRYACWTHWEDAFAKVLVEYMLRVGTKNENQAEVRNCVYIDCALAANCGQSERPSTRIRVKDVGTNSKNQLDASLSTLQRVGMAAVDLYCLTIFGTQFDAIPDPDKKGVLRVLDNIKLVFQDGSDAGVFFTAVYPTVVNSPASANGEVDAVASMNGRLFRSVSASIRHALPVLQLERASG